MLTAVTGINWGDEGKGRVIDLLAEQADIVVRYQEETMPDIPLLPIRENLYLICFLPEFCIQMSSASSEMAWL